MADDENTVMNLEENRIARGNQNKAESTLNELLDSVVYDEKHSLRVQLLRATLLTPAQRVKAMTVLIEAAQGCLEELGRPIQKRTAVSRVKLAEL